MQIQVIVLVMNRWEELVNTSIIRRHWCCFFCLYNDWMLQVRLQSLEEEKQLNDLSHTGFYKVVQRAPPLLASLQRTEWNNEAEMIRGALKGSYWLLVMFKTHNLCSRTQTSEADWGQVMTHLKLLMLPSHARVLKPLSHENSASVQRWVLHVACFTVWVDVFLTVLSHLQLVFLPSCRWFWRSALSA